MNSFLGLTGIAIQVLNDFEDARIRTQAKIDDAIKRYHNSKVLPRKKKKAAKKSAEFDYNFWISIQIWEKEVFNF